MNDQRFVIGYEAQYSMHLSFMKKNIYLEVNSKYLWHAGPILVFTFTTCEIEKLVNSCQMIMEVKYFVKLLDPTTVSLEPKLG